jgi:hypothetical protein
MIAGETSIDGGELVLAKGHARGAARPAAAPASGNLSLR